MPRMSIDKTPRKNIEDIRVGSWEAGMKCPPAGTKTGSQVIQEINHEMYPGLKVRRDYERMKDADKKIKRRGLK